MATVVFAATSLAWRFESYLAAVQRKSLRTSTRSISVSLADCVEVTYLPEAPRSKACCEVARRQSRGAYLEAMYEVSKTLKRPDDSRQPCWRYVDSWKLRSVLETDHLFVSHLPTLEDSYEGRLTERSREGLARWFQKQNDSTQTAAYEQVGLHEQHIKDFYINCRHMNRHESFLMWKAYSNRGFAIRTTYERLQDSFNVDVRRLQNGGQRERVGMLPGHRGILAQHQSKPFVLASRGSSARKTMTLRPMWLSQGRVRSSAASAVPRVLPTMPSMTRQSSGFWWGKAADLPACRHKIYRHSPSRVASRRLPAA